MDQIAFRAALKSLGLPQYRAAIFLGVQSSTIQNWAHGRTRVPQHVGMLLRLMIAMKLSPEKVGEWLAENRAA